VIRTLPASLGARTAAFVAVLLAAVWLAAAPAAAQQGPRFPTLTGRVVDQADLIPADKEAELTAKLEALETDTTDQLVVVTVSDLQGYEIEEYGYQLGRAWGIGQTDKDNGVLLIVAPNEKKVRIEVGYGLEGVLTDALSALIIHNDILPPFREGRFDQGIEAGVTAIDHQLRLDPAEAQARAAAAAAERPRSKAPVVPGLFILVVFAFIALNVLGALGSRGRRRRGDGIAPILIWAASEALRNSGRGGGGSWGGGGGGFGGGGGGFGGGGASGGW
jgi:uncharacterized protein